MLLNILGSIVGLVLGGIASILLLTGFFYIWSLFIEDKSALGFAWAIYFLVVPGACVAGAVAGYGSLEKVFNGLNT